MKKAVSYLRVSTQKQGVSGLGQEAQRASVAAFAKAEGYEIVAEYAEIESGKNDSRPNLQRALAHAKKLGGTVLIAKLDRLARSVSFISKLMDSNTDFRAVDVPGANRLILHIMAAVGEAEARAISDRTKAALSAAKARGVLLGGANPQCKDNLSEEARAKGVTTLKAKARTAYAELLPKIRTLKGQGMSLQQIADALNAEGQVTRTGKEWHAIQVSRALKSAEVSA